MALGDGLFELFGVDRSDVGTYAFGKLAHPLHRQNTPILLNSSRSNVVLPLL